jgi:hypothetical protein
MASSQYCARSTDRCTSGSGAARTDFAPAIRFDVVEWK